MAHIMAAGRDIWFDPSRVTMVTPGVAGHGSEVYGITEGVVQVGDTPSALLQALGIDRRFAQLTLPGNSPVWLNAKDVAWVQAVPPQSPYAAGVQSLVSLNGGKPHGVTEALQVAVDALKQAGAPI